MWKVITELESLLAFQTFPPPASEAPSPLPPRLARDAQHVALSRCDDLAIRQLRRLHTPRLIGPLGRDYCASHGLEPHCSAHPCADHWGNDSAGLWRYGLNSLVHLILPVVGLEVRADGVGRRRQLAFQHDDITTSPQRGPNK
jgi:hypothetical protein